jgi:3-phenylpropionate/trans-cinnamate dioxygenase ferredoxin subunit
MARYTWYKVYDFHRHGHEPQPVNSVRTLDVEGKRISLAFDGSNYYALADRCPHAGARFGAGGWCDNGFLVCPVHRYKYNLVNGKGVQGDYIETYKAEVRKDGVYIGLPSPKKWWWPFT